jgi:Spy/CpxP family protein refolding chaperone
MNLRIARLAPALLVAFLPLAPLSGAEGASHGRHFPGDRPFLDEERMDRLAEHQSERLTRALDLTPEQQVTLGRLQDDLEEAVSPLSDQMRSAHQRLRTLLDVAAPDPAAVGTQAIAIDRARDAMRTAWEEFEADFTAILSETQRAGYRALQEARPDRGAFGERRGRRDHRGRRH